MNILSLHVKYSVAAIAIGGVTRVSKQEHVLTLLLKRFVPHFTEAVTPFA